MKPLVTVVTITFNLLDNDREKTFRQCLESVHNQTYDNIEHIIIDGASQDGTVDLLEEYSQKGWIKYYSEPDTGIYNAFNKGVDRANGEYIVFLNSDDFYHNNLGVEKSVETLLKTGADFSYADEIRLNEENPKKTKIHKAEIHKVFYQMPFGHQTMFTKKDALLAIGKFDEKYKSAGDYDLIIRLKMAGYKCAKTPCNFCTFRLGGESSVNNDISINEVIAIYQDLYQTFCPLTYKQARHFFYTRFAPLKLHSSMWKYFSPSEKIPFIWFFVRKALFKNVRRWFIQVRLNTTEKSFRFFGVWLIKPKWLRQDENNSVPTL